MAAGAAFKGRVGRGAAPAWLVMGMFPAGQRFTFSRRKCPRLCGPRVLSRGRPARPCSVTGPLYSGLGPAGLAGNVRAGVGARPRATRGTSEG